MYKKIAEWIIPLSCIFLQYGTFGGTYGLWFLLVLFCVFVLKKGFFRIDKDFLLIGILISLQQVMSSIIFHMDWEVCIENILKLIMIIIAVSVGLFAMDRENIIRIYKRIGIVCAIAIYWQTIMHNLFGQSISAITILPLEEGAKAYWADNIDRACGFFSEPQVYCSYMLPLLLICLVRAEYKFSVFLSLSFVLTGSSLGIAMVALLWCGVWFKSKISNDKKVAMLLAIALAVILFLTMDVFVEAREKIATIFRDFSLYSSIIMTTHHSYSNYLRLIKGWATFFELPFGAMILGVGITNLVPYMHEFGVSFSWNDFWSVEGLYSTYITSGAGILIECGLVVGLIYYFFVVKKAIKGTTMAKLIIAFLIIQGFMTQTFLNGIFIFYFLMYYVLNENNANTVRFSVTKKGTN